MTLRNLPSTFGGIYNLRHAWEDGHVLYVYAGIDTDALYGMEEPKMQFVPKTMGWNADGDDQIMVDVEAVG